MSVKLDHPLNLPGHFTSIRQAATVPHNTNNTITMSVPPAESCNSLALYYYVLPSCSCMPDCDVVVY